MDMSIASTGDVTVRLSKRNLLALLAKLEQNEAEARHATETGVLRLGEMSACTIARHTDDGILTVTAEADVVHYGGRTPGEMAPRTEAMLPGYGGD